MRNCPPPQLQRQSPAGDVHRMLLDPLGHFLQFSPRHAFLLTCAGPDEGKAATGVVDRLLSKSKLMSRSSMVEQKAPSPALDGALVTE